MNDDLAVRQDRYERYQRSVEVPLLAVALALIPLLILPLVVDLPARAEQALVVADVVIWAVFAGDYVVGFVLAPSRRTYLRSQWLNLMLVVLPVLRPLRVLRSTRLLRLLRLMRLASAISVGTREARRLLVRHKLHYAILATAVITVGCALSIFIVESGGDGPIDTIADAFWWAVSTMTTVGYGDLYPTTPAGRGVALVLMVTGIAFFGILTANLATYLMERSVGEDDEERAILTRLDEIVRRLEALDAAGAVRRGDPC